MEIKVYIQNVYGTDKFYPNCDLSHKLASFKGQKTLTQQDLQKIKEMGIKVDFVLKNQYQGK